MEESAFCSKCPLNRPPVVKDTTSQGLNLVIGDVHLLKSVYTESAKA